MSLLGFSPDCVTGAEEDIFNHARPLIFPKCLLIILPQELYVKTMKSIDESKDKFEDVVGDDDDTR